MSTNKIKAKRMWAWRGKSNQRLYGRQLFHKDIPIYDPVLILPNTAESYDQMVEIIAYEVQSGDAIGRPWIDTARNIMSRLNITRPKEGKK